MSPKTPWKKKFGDFVGQTIIVDRETGRQIGEVCRISQFRIVQFVAFSYTDEYGGRDRLGSFSKFWSAAQTVYEKSLADRRIERR